MDGKRIKVFVLLVYLIDITASNSTECLNNKTGLYECCQDYGNVSGNCEACIGSWGKECSNNCLYGHFGHGCRQRCDCTSQQICDPRRGCVEASTSAVSTTTVRVTKSHLDYLNIEAYLFIASGLLVLLLLNTVVICQRKLKNRRKTLQRFTDRQEDIIYDDISDSQIVASGDATLTKFCNLQTDLNGTLDSEEYGHWYQGSDNYNHINFNSVKQLSPHSNVMTNDYEAFKSSETSTACQVNDTECNGNKEIKKNLLGKKKTGKSESSNQIKLDI